MTSDLIAALHRSNEDSKFMLARIAELEAENSAIRTLMNCYNLGGWTDVIEPMKRAERAEAECERLRELLRRVLQATSPNMSMDMYAEVCRAIDAAIGEGN